VADHRLFRLLSRIVASPVPRLVYRWLRAWQRLTRPVTVGVRVVVIDDGGRVLLVHHSYVAGWHLPGGRVRTGETTAAAAGRELHEETGLRLVGPPRLLGLYGRFGHGGSDHVAVHVAAAWTGTLTADGREVDGCGFFAFDALPDGTTPGTRARLAEHCGLAATSDRW